jgi:hypothetical protein
MTQQESHYPPSPNPLPQDAYLSGSRGYTALHADRSHMDRPVISPHEHAKDLDSEALLPR